MINDRITHAVIEATSRCNFKCPFCAGRYLSSGDMSLDKYKMVLSQLPNLKYLYLSGEGEGFLNQHFFRMALIAKEKGILLFHVTNGSLLNQKRINQIMEIGFEEINISTETLKADRFWRIRGGDWRQIKLNIKELASRRGQIKKPVIRINFNVLKSSFYEIEDVIELSQDLEIELPNLFWLQNKDDYRQFYPAELEKEILSLKERQTVLEYIHKYSAPSVFWGSLYNSNRHKPCPFLNSFIWVSQDGKIAPCCYIKRYDQLDMGNAFDDNGIITALTKPIINELDIGLRNNIASCFCTNCTVIELHRWKDK